MHSANVTDTIRRSSRVPITLPIAVTSLEPSTPFSEICETLVVSAHGCAIFSPAKLEAGIPVQFRRKGGGATMAHVVGCKPMGAGQQGWQVAARLDHPENFWGLEACPEDWARLLEIHSDEPQSPRKLTRSRFDISLSHIPPEVEEKLWVRLRDDLGPQVLKQTQEQSAQVLGSAKTMIDQNITGALGGFRQQVTQELKTVEQRAHGLTEAISEAVGQHFNTGAEQ